MSQFPPNDPPPMPPAPPPVPVISMAGPRVHPQPTYGGPASHTYAELSAYRAKPGGLTAIGVISIVVAGLSFLAGLVGGCESMVVQQVTQISKVLAKSSAPPGSGNGAVSAETIAADDRKREGLPPVDRQLVTSVLGEMQTMDTDRATELNAFLAWQGKHLFPTSGGHLTRAQVQESVNSSNTIPPPSDTESGTTVFITSWGTLRVQDHGTAFAPSDGSSVIQVTSAEFPVEAPAPGTAPTDPANSADPNAPAGAPVASGTSPQNTDDGSGAVPAGPATAPATAGTTPGTGVRLTPTEVRAALQKVQAASGNKLTPAQIASLKTALEDPAQAYITAGTAWSPVRAVNVGPDGSAFIWLSGGYLNMDPKGTIAPMFDPFSKGIHINQTYIRLSGLYAIVTIAMAIFLFLSALSVLRQTPHGRRMHLIFACLNIPVVILGGLVISRMTEEFGNSVHATGAWGSNVMIFNLLGLAYPIVLLVVMNVGSIKAYYAPVRG